MRVVVHRSFLTGKRKGWKHIWGWGPPKMQSGPQQAGALSVLCPVEGAVTARGQLLGAVQSDLVKVYCDLNDKTRVQRNEEGKADGPTLPR